MSTMPQVWITGPGEVGVREVSAPAAAAGEVVVETAFAGICGSDLHTLRRGHPWLPYPIAPGHEASGVVVEVGAGVSPSRRGERVYLQPVLACGHCFYCLRGRTNLCDELVGVGSHVPGAFADRFVVPAAAARPIPAGMSFVQAALVEPFATVAHALRLVGGVEGRTVAVLGGGSIGQACLLGALANGAEAVVVTDPVAGKRERARALGATAVLDASTPDLRAAVSAELDGRPDVIIDCVASAATVQAAVALAVKGGSVLVVGVGHGPVELEIEVVQDQEVAVIGSAMYTAEDFVRAEQIVLATASAELVTAVVPMAQAADGFALAVGGEQTKVHLSGPAA
jgi:2-desacetyl-2-hydroxyethyl bacteriochlorophyllide A dehydrogenase